eukprot:CAMPEP_0198287720 /NCGR_PEP_ID=MMETSP1449-20131203/6431_1 /TAXON_ID=420275 /ORGANISM="Attheya septentrionalis, Strain CCMP2084" /LENGTH=680 /DNA_ID=CAMNT_0043985711 /DNA_START=56 /DNA_END=2101 /DNA_ORIENTATION=+
MTRKRSRKRDYLQYLAHIWLWLEVTTSEHRVSVAWRSSSSVSLFVGPVARTKDYGTHHIDPTSLRRQSVYYLQKQHSDRILLFRRGKERRKVAVCLASESGVPPSLPRDSTGQEADDLLDTLGLHDVSDTDYYYIEGVDDEDDDDLIVQEGGWIVQNPTGDQGDEAWLATSSSERDTGSNSMSMASLLKRSGLQYAPVEKDENIQKQAKEIAYFYLQNDLGLSEETMWKITHEAGSILGLTVENLKAKVALLTRMMNLSPDDLRTMISRQPSILHLSANSNVAPTILFLVRALEFSKDELCSIVTQYPSILCYSTKNLQTKINFYIWVMGYSVGECRDLVLAEPKLMTAGVQTGLVPRMQFLHKEIEIPLNVLRKIVKKNPLILLYSVDNNLRPKLIDYFIMKLCMSPVDVQRILLAYPAIMNYRLEEHIMPITRYFVADLEFSPMEFRNILLKFPRIMTYSLRKIKHVVGYLRFELGMNAVQVKRVLFQAPQAIGFNTDINLKSKIYFLRNTFHLNEEELRTVVAGMPTLICCGIESNLAPKAQYLLEQFDYNGLDLKMSILTQPTLMGYSLEKRIRPRMERILKIGASPQRITVGISMSEVNFGDWLQKKKAKIKLNGGTEPFRRKKTKKKEAPGDVVNAKNRPIALLGASPDLLPEIPKNREEQNGRIVHWNRKRQP